MRFSIRALPALAVAAIAAALCMVVPTNHASAATTGDSSSCHVHDLGDMVPVILVHGFTGHASDWGKTSDPGSMIAKIQAVPGTYVETFDYSSTNTAWVTDPNNGPRLAQRINCLSAASGGGKVDLIDHSMGGLMTRYAASLTVHGHLVSDEIGLVVTLGTPNLGSSWANVSDPVVATICSEADGLNPWQNAGSSICPDYTALTGLQRNSGLIQTVPWLPTSIPLKAIAGDVTLTAPLFHSWANDDTRSDLFVGTDSALAAKQVTRSVEVGAGNSTFRCRVPVTSALSASCWHKGLLTNPSVQKAVTDSIRANMQNGPWGQFMTDGGKWYVHGSNLQIVPNGTSTETSNIGPCADPYAGNGDPVQMCNTDLAINFKPAAGSLVGTITDVRYTTWSGGPPPDGFQPPQDGFQVGQSFELQPTQYPHLLEVVYTDNSPQGPNGGNSNFCQDGLASSQQYRCGA